MVDTEKYDIKNYVYTEIIEECNKYTEPEEQVNYLKFVLYKWENDPPRLILMVRWFLHLRRGYGIK